MNKKINLAILLAALVIPVSVARAGLVPEAQDKLDGKLRTAIIQQDLPKVKELVGMGADVNAKRDGVPMLFYAARADNLDIVEYLVEKGAEFKKAKDRGDYGILFSAQTLPMLKYFVGLGVDPKEATTSGYTILHLRAGEGDLDQVKYLVETCKVDITPRYKSKGKFLTPQQLAQGWEHEKVVKYLAEKEKEAAESLN